VVILLHDSAFFANLRDEVNKIKTLLFVLTFQPLDICILTTPLHIYVSMTKNNRYCIFLCWIPPWGSRKRPKM